MKTTQIMKRDFNNSQISQRTSDKFFNATEMLALYNNETNQKRRIVDFWENQNTKEFIKELEKDLILNVEKMEHLKTYETSRGKGGATWMHPYLFVKFAMWLSPKFELQIIKWVYDNLIDFRNDAGDFYKEMCQALKDYIVNNGLSLDPLMYQKEAGVLNTLVFGSERPRQRNEANEFQLALMNDLQKYNIYLLQKNTKNRLPLLMERKNVFIYMNKKP
jgi:hypothetical protein